MADRHKAKLDQDANQIMDWLVAHRAEFEQQGVSEDSLTGAVGVSNVEELKLAVDHLENREIVVRWPEELSSPPRFTLKPGRAWADACAKALGTTSAGGAK